MDVVNLDRVAERVRKVRELASSWDPEAAHGAEDALHVEVLRAIAGGAEEPAMLAAKALESVAIEFPRHCA